MKGRVDGGQDRRLGLQGNEAKKGNPRIVAVVDHTIHATGNAAAEPMLAVPAIWRGVL